ncbi:NIPSNAP family protein [Arthrobacter sp. B1805]|uniref:NIPSNAP family protein n=1 Tax=Arthrobacter sp. B1805 TaxID=2058892 RepID=UPI000CE30E91|nr:NIPSNAP family protein [Arthrobacter sp. B1805]
MTYELRTYTANPGRMDALMARFRDNTIDLFTEHNMRSLGYWTPVGTDDVLVYLLEHDGDPKANWAAFAADQRWIDAKAASEADGPLTATIESVLLDPTDLYPIADAKRR